MKVLMVFGFVLLVLKSIERSNIEEIQEKEMDKISPIIKMCVATQEILLYIEYAIIILAIISMLLL